MECLFCKIARGEIPAKIIYQDEAYLAFDDIHPQAPQHKVIIPRRHISTLNALTASDASCVGGMIVLSKKLAEDLKISEAGYRLVINCNIDGGQTVFHLHLHLLGGRAMQWPPG